MARKDVCLYHSTDLDGHCGGAICAKAKPGIHLHGIDYGDQLPWDLIDGSDLIAVDWSFSPVEVLLEILMRVNSLVWLDHHKTSVEVREKLDDYDHLTTVLDTSKAGCEIAWEYFYPNEPMPLAVWLLGRYDVWDHQDDRVIPFQYRLRMEETDPVQYWSDSDTGMIWDQLLTPRIGEYGVPVSKFSTPSVVQRFINEGYLLERYQRSGNAKIAQRMTYELQWLDMRWLVVNRCWTGSKLFESVWDPNKYHGMISFGWDGRRWRVSLYTDRHDVDVSAIATAHGGGGHAGAAGFECEHLPFDMNEICHEDTCSNE